MFETYASLRSQQCKQASQFFAAIQDVSGKVQLTRALYKQVLRRFLYKHKQVFALVYGSQHGFPESESERQGMFTRVYGSGFRGLGVTVKPRTHG